MVARGGDASAARGELLACVKVGLGIARGEVVGAKDCCPEDLSGIDHAAEVRHVVAVEAERGDVDVVDGCGGETLHGDDDVEAVIFAAHDAVEGLTGRRELADLIHGAGGAGEVVEIARLDALAMCERDGTAQTDRLGRDGLAGTGWRWGLRVRRQAADERGDIRASRKAGEIGLRQLHGARFLILRHFRVKTHRPSRNLVNFPPERDSLPREGVPHGRTTQTTSAMRIDRAGSSRETH